MAMRFIKKYSIELRIAALSVFLFFVSRIYGITSLPIFTDEAIYIRWAQIAKDDAAWRFISLTDGKQPLFVWFMMISMKFFQDPLFAGRIVSVFAGFLTMVGLYFLGKEIFRNRAIGIISALIYLIFPMGLVYDRMALYDSLVATFAVWILYLEILLVRKLRLDIALILGMVSGLSVLNKSSGFFGVALIPFSLILADFQKKQRKKLLLKWPFYVGVIVVITFGFYSLLRLSPFYHIINEKNATFVFPLQEWLQHPFSQFYENFKALLNWFTTYTTLPLVFMMLLSFVIRKEYMREKILLTLWFVAPFIYLMFFGKVIYPRYILFMIVPLIPLMGYSIVAIYEKVKNKLIFALLIAITLSMALYSDFFILTRFQNAPIPESDLGQYATDWPSGVGVLEAVNFFQKQSEKQKIYVATEGTFGLMPNALEIFLSKNKNIVIKGYWPIKDELPEDLQSIRNKMPVYFLFYQPCPSCPANGEAPPMWPLKKEVEIPKKVGTLTVFRVLPK